MSPYDIKTCDEHPHAAHRVLPFVDGTPAEVECLKCKTLIPQGPSDADNRQANPQDHADAT
jgi:hypothetical protein